MGHRAQPAPAPAPGTDTALHGAPAPGTRTALHRHRAPTQPCTGHRAPAQPCLGHRAQPGTGHRHRAPAQPCTGHRAQPCTGTGHRHSPARGTGTGTDTALHGAPGTRTALLGAPGTARHWAPAPGTGTALHGAPGTALHRHRAPTQPCTGHRHGHRHSPARGTGHPHSPAWGTGHSPALGTGTGHRHSPARGTGHSPAPAPGTDTALHGAPARAPTQPCTGHRAPAQPCLGHRAQPGTGHRHRAPTQPCTGHRAQPCTGTGTGTALHGAPGTALHRHRHRAPTQPCTGHRAQPCTGTGTGHRHSPARGTGHSPAPAPAPGTDTALHGAPAPGTGTALHGAPGTALHRHRHRAPAQPCTGRRHRALGTGTGTALHGAPGTALHRHRHRHSPAWGTGTGTGTALHGAPGTGTALGHRVSGAENRAPSTGHEALGVTSDERSRQRRGGRERAVPGAPPLPGSCRRRQSCRMQGLRRALSRCGTQPRPSGRAGLSAAAEPSARALQAQGWILDPAGDWYYWWISVMVLPIMYNWIILICRSCFADLQEQHALVWLSLDYLCDALYLLDIAVRCHTGFLEEGILVRDPAQIRRRYLGSPSFPWDVASVLPTDLLYLRLGLGAPAVRANRCLRAPRLLEAFDRRETRTGYPNAFRIAKLMLYVFVTIHWNACLYFALSTRLGLGADAWVCPNASRPGFARPLRQYLYSFYFSTLILATVGDTPEPRREEEFLFVIAGFLLAVLGFATIMGSMSSVISNVNAADAAFYPDHDPVQHYLQTHGVGRRLARRVARWHQHLRAHKKLTEERGVLRHLPARLRAEVAASVHLPALRKVALFQSCERGVLEELVLKLRPQVFSPGEFVCRKGDVGREMYFVREGRLAVVADDGVTQLAVLGEGLYFGEISLINIKGNKSGNRRTANIKSIGYSDLFCLSKEDLREVLAEFPSARAMMEAKGREILLRLDKLDVHAEAAAAAAAEEAERRARALEAALEGLQTRVARLLAQLESSAFKLALRIERLERRLRRRGAAGEPGPAGAQGPATPRGPAGGQGPTRAPGPSGAPGPTRVQGPATPRGPAGGQGPTRAPGPSGAPGPTRAQVPATLRGPAGGQGDAAGQGDAGQLLVRVQCEEPVTMVAR
ncbi:cyclic nucleotide-gated channel alpha-4 [Struthio camelus]|uniref:cyclic nucleotide-gated channel alpha-4 n=1 Tax=Struthio camelus TaxID=8801 RepID=UPI003603D9DC